METLDESGARIAALDRDVRALAAESGGDLTDLTARIDIHRAVLASLHAAPVDVLTHVRHVSLRIEVGNTEILFLVKRLIVQRGG